MAVTLRGAILVAAGTVAMGGVAAVTAGEADTAAVGTVVEGTDGVGMGVGGTVVVGMGMAVLPTGGVTRIRMDTDLMVGSPN